MQSSTRTNQGGSILIFTIVAVVLALALIGSVLFVRHKGEVAQTKVPIFGPVTAPLEVPDGKDGTTDGSSPTPAPTSEGEDKSASPTPVAAPSNSDAASVSELPKTGPVDIALSVIIIALVTMTTVSYVRSRHLSWQL